MKRWIATGLALLGLCLSPPVLAQSQDAFTAQALSDHIQALSDDSFQGRRPGTEGEQLTLAYLQAQYEAMGLEPGGPDGQWTQDVELLRYTPLRTPTASWTSGGRERQLEVGRDIILRADSGDGAAQITDAPLIFVGFGIHAPEYGWDDYGDIDVTGAIVVVVAGEPVGELFDGDRQTLYANRSYKNAEAHRRGAVGVLMIAMAPASHPSWQAAARAAAGTMTTVEGLNPIDFSGSINRDLATAFAEAGDLDIRQLQALISSGDFQAAPLGDATMSVDIAQSREVFVTRNLIARLPGTERPDETILYSAHWDHMGVADQPNAAGDTIYNGAWDNASGTAALLEMARRFAAGPRPERSLVFVHLTAEEMGLLGAFFYTFNPVYPLEATVAAINIDMLPMSGPTLDIPVFGHGLNTLEDDLQAVAAHEGRTVTDDGMPERGLFFRSDHFPFALAGVPILMLGHGTALDEGGREVGWPAYGAYFETYYHGLEDEWREDLDYRAALENLELLWRVSSDLANSDRWPTWKTDSIFAATRAATDSARQ